MIRKALAALLVLGLGTMAVRTQQVVQPAVPKSWAEKMFSADPSGVNPPPTLVHDFGPVAHGAQLVWRYPITNHFQVPLQLTLRPSCGCVKPKANPPVLNPQQTGEIEVEMDTTRFLNEKKVTVQVSVQNGAQYFSTAELEVKATIRQDVVFNPGKLVFGPVMKGQPRETQVEVDYAGALAPTWAIQGIEINGAPVEAKSELVARDDPARPGRVKYRLTANLSKNAPLGPLNQEIFIKTNDPASPLLPLTIEAFVQPPLEVRPDPLNFGGARVGVASAPMMVKVRGDKPFSVTAVNGLANGLALATPLPTLAAQAQVLTFQFQPTQAGVFKQQITIQTNLQAAPVTLTVEAVVLD